MFFALFLFPAPCTLNVLSVVHIAQMVELHPQEIKFPQYSLTSCNLIYSYAPKQGAAPLGE